MLVLFFLIASLILVFIPTPFDALIPQAAEQVRGKVLATDDSTVHQVGMIRTGEQQVTVKIVDGSFKGRILTIDNPLLGRLDRDTVYRPGDTGFVVLSLGPGNTIIHASLQNHYRINYEIMLFSIFGLLLILFAGVTGLKALLSFVFAALCIWKWLVPSLLTGVDPLLATLAATTVMTGAIILLVGGAGRKGLTALGGAVGGIFLSGILALIFTGKMQIHGAVMPFAETLLYSGFGHLDLTRLYVAGIFLASSGAVMDLAMDVAAAMHEIREHNPKLSRFQLVRSGFSVGRAVTGTMTTTLLFAYSGGYLTMLMAFMAQGIPLANTFNLIYVAAEFLKTMVGSIGLLAVAPLTAIVGGVMLPSQKDSQSRPSRTIHRID